MTIARSVFTADVLPRQQWGGQSDGGAFGSSKGNPGYQDLVHSGLGAFLDPTQGPRCVFWRFVAPRGSLGVFWGADAFWGAPYHVLGFLHFRTLFYTLFATVYRNARICNLFSRILENLVCSHSASLMFFCTILAISNFFHFYPALSINKF